MKKFTTEEIMNALIANNSLGYESDGLYYYLHITDDGEILSDIHGADKTFMYPVEYTNENEVAWDKESADDEDFMEVVEALTAEANEYIADMDAATKKFDEILDGILQEATSNPDGAKD